MLKIVRLKSKCSHASTQAPSALRPSRQGSAEIVCLESVRLGQLPVSSTPADVVIMTTANRHEMLAQVCRSAAVGGRAGEEWAKVAEFLARQFQANPAS